MTTDFFKTNAKKFNHQESSHKKVVEIHLNSHLIANTHEKIIWKDKNMFHAVQTKMKIKDPKDGNCTEQRVTRGNEGATEETLKP